MKQAGVKEVLEKIVRRVRDWDLAQALAGKVKQFVQTHNPADDLTPHETNLIYRPDEYGEVVPLSHKKDLDVEWTSHAEYRSDLRNVNPDKVNQTIVDRLLSKLPHPDRKKVEFHEPGVGTIVVDYDMTRQPAEADVVTVWASRRDDERRQRLRELKEMKLRVVVPMDTSTKVIPDKTKWNRGDRQRTKFDLRRYEGCERRVVASVVGSKCREILPPEPFDFKQPPEPPVVFLAGAIDMGQAEDETRRSRHFWQDGSTWGRCKNNLIFLL